MIRLLVVFKNDGYFGGELELLGTYNDPAKAVNDGLSVWDDTVEYMFLNERDKWIKFDKAGIEKITLSEVQKNY